MSDFEHQSWFDPCGYYDGKCLYYSKGWLVSQIFFATNIYDLDDRDKKALDMLYTVYAPGLLGNEQKIFRFVGYADYRDTEKHNETLALSRAYSVKKYLDNRFSKLRSYKSEAEGLGERYSTKSPQVEVLAGDRRVDIFAPYRIQSSIRLPPVVITGKYTGLLSNKFNFRTIIGASVGKAGIGVQSFWIEVENSRTNKKATYTYVGAGPSAGFQFNRPTKWEEKEVKDLKGNPVWMDVDDFEGPGKVGSAGIGLMKSIYTFRGPKNHGRCEDAVFVDFTGWDIAAGVGVDYEGYWKKYEL